MSQFTYEARVKLPGGGQEVVRVQASNQVNAKKMLEAQYGKGSLIGSPTPNTMI